jgi:hypothetical protein
MIDKCALRNRPAADRQTHGHSTFLKKDQQTRVLSLISTVRYFFLSFLSIFIYLFFPDIFMFPYICMSLFSLDMKGLVSTGWEGNWEMGIWKWETKGLG